MNKNKLIHILAWWWIHFNFGVTYSFNTSQHFGLHTEQSDWGNLFGNSNLSSGEASQPQALMQKKKMYVPPPPPPPPKLNGLQLS